MDNEMEIDSLDLSVRSYNALRRANINTIEDLPKRTMDELMTIRNLGNRSATEIVRKLAEEDLWLRKPLGLSENDLDCLKNAGVNVVGELVAKSEEELTAILGKASAAKFFERLNMLNLLS